MSELEKSISYIKESVYEYRVALFWLGVCIGSFFLAAQVKEIVALLLASYALALILDPLVSRLQGLGMRRGISIISLGFFFVTFIVFGLVVGLPSIVKEFQEFGNKLPDYLSQALATSAEKIEYWLGVELPKSFSELPDLARKFGADVKEGSLSTLAAAGLKTLLKGYSLALTVVNLFLLPFFVFYLTRDLHKFHAHIKSFLSADAAENIGNVGHEMLQHVHAFLKGQITVCIILACLYSIGLLLVGLPSAIAVGILSGLLNIIPYFGLAIGLLLASILTLVSDPTLLGFGKVYAVFIIVQTLEGSIITPKIVGESVGIHPLVVMVALIVGGQLFGLIGLLVAIPFAASLRVVMNRLLESLDEEPEQANA